MGKKNRKSNAAVVSIETFADGSLDMGAELVVSVDDNGAETIFEDVAQIEDGAEIVLDAEHTSVITDEVVNELESDEAKRAAYAAQSAELVADGAAVPSEVVEAVGEIEPTESSTPVKAPKAKRLSTVGLTASQAILQTLGASPENFFALDSTESVDADDLRNVMTTTLEAIDKLDKKSREKATGVFSALVSGKLPSVYIRQAIVALKEGPMTLKQMVTYYATEGKYASGTASRQAQQMFALLPLLKITKRAAERNAPMDLNPHSTLLQAFTKTA